jgi:leucyl aminopeptidase
VALEIQLSSAGVADFATGLLAVAMDEKPGAATLEDLDRTLGGELQRSISAREFRGARDETLQFTGTRNGPRRVVLIGMGKTKDRAISLLRAAAVAALQDCKLG